MSDNGKSTFSQATQIEFCKCTIFFLLQLNQACLVMVNHYRILQHTVTTVIENPGF